MRKNIQKAVDDNYNNRNHKNKFTYVPTGSTLLDLACSDGIEGGFVAGSMVNIIGDSSVGKSLQCLTLLSEICRNKKFDDYQLIYDDTEFRLNFDLEKFFGKKLKSRIQFPGGLTKDNKPICSNKIEDVEYNILKAIKKKKPFIYILDSLDAVTSKQNQEKQEERFNAKEKNKEVSGSYGLSVPKFIPEMIRGFNEKIYNTESLIIIVSQTRQNINAAFGAPKNVRSGGTALKFHCNHEVWLTHRGKIVTPNKIKIGNQVLAKITKNSITGKERQAPYNVYNEYGIDDIQSCIAYLVENNYWKKTKQTIEASELNLKGTEQSLIKQIEEKNLESNLKKITKRCWSAIEEKARIKRKKKYE